MKKIFSLFAAVLMAGSMMAEVKSDTIKWGAAVAQADLAASYASPTNADFVFNQVGGGSIDGNTFRFGTADDYDKYAFRFKAGGATNGTTRTFSLSIPEAGTLKVAARTASSSNENRTLTLKQGEQTLAAVGCPDDQSLAPAADGSGSVLSYIEVEVEAGTINIELSGAINFYSFILETGDVDPVESELLYEMTTDEKQGSNNSYAGNCDIEMGGVVWNFTGNSQQNPWRIGGKSITAETREVYTKTAYAAALDSVCLHLGNNTLTSLDSVKLVYSTNADFSEAQEVAATIPATFPATVTFAVAGGFPANAYYKFVFTCTVSGTSNKYIQFNGVDFWGVRPDAPAVEAPVFTEAAGSYYDPQTIHLTCETEGAVILYTTDGTVPVLGTASVYMPQYGIYLGEGTTATIKAIAYNNDSDNPQYSEVVEKTYTIATQYASLDELVAAGAPAGQKVVVTLTNETIDSLYVSSSNKTNGVYLTAGGRMVEIYCYDVPSTWAVGGTISGTVKGEWKKYNDTWEVCPSSWEGITYKVALPEGPAITVGTDKITFTPANDELIWCFGLLTEYVGNISQATAELMAESMVLDFEADWTLEDAMDISCYAGAMEVGFAELELPEGNYGAFAFTVEESDPVTHAVVVTSKVSFVPFTVSPATAIDNVETVKAVKTIENGNIVIIKNGIRYNTAGQKL